MAAVSYVMPVRTFKEADVSAEVEQGLLELGATLERIPRLPGVSRSR